MTTLSVEETDDQLAAECSHRDGSSEDRGRAEAAFRTLYDRHAKRLIAFLGGRVSRSVLDDVHQIVWMKVWQTIPTFHGGNFRAWIHQIARNVAIDQLRKRKEKPLAEEGELIDLRQVNISQSEETERRDALARCLQKLERANAQVADLVRCRVAGESYQAYCVRTGIPEDKAYRAFHQAKSKLQACVEQQS